jgi:predicted RNA binding protein YcfA (HicA-like mRNA interferase family)
MPPFGPISRRQLIRCLRRAGFSGPRGKGAHQFMTKGDLDLTIPNPHRRRDIGVGLLKKVLEQAGISKEQWEEL